MQDKTLQRREEAARKRNLRRSAGNAEGGRGRSRVTVDAVTQVAAEGRDGAGQSNANVFSYDKSEMSVLDMLMSTNTIAWGGIGQRKARKRKAYLVEHLRNYSSINHQRQMFLMLVSYEETRVPNLQQPYIRCSSTSSIEILRKDVAKKTSLEFEEIELYVVKECPESIVTGEGKLNPNIANFHFLRSDDETLDQFTNFLTHDYLVIAYKKKRWDLNEALPWT